MRGLEERRPMIDDRMLGKAWKLGWRKASKPSLWAKVLLNRWRIGFIDG